MLKGRERGQRDVKASNARGQHWGGSEEAPGEVRGGERSVCTGGWRSWEALVKALGLRLQQGKKNCQHPGGGQALEKALASP